VKADLVFLMTNILHLGRGKWKLSTHRVDIPTDYFAFCFNRYIAPAIPIIINTKAMV